MELISHRSISGDAKTASARLLSCDFSWSGYLPVSSFLIACQGGDTYPVSQDSSGSVNPYNRFSFGGGRLSCVPVLPLSACDMF